MNPTTRARAGVVLLLLLLGAGTFAYMLVERVSPLDAFYMVIITVTTVGFEEVFELSPGGRAVTIGIIAVGVGVAFYTAGAVFELFLDAGSRRWRQRQVKQINTLSEHIILCGYGKVGKGCFDLLRQKGAEVVVIEDDADNAEAARSAGALLVIGNATHDQTLLDAGIEKARTVIACVTEDAENLVIVLSAKAISPSIRVLSRASELEWEAKLRRAGADQVVAPPVVGSERLAALAFQESLTGIMDVSVPSGTMEFYLEEVRVSEKSPVANQTIRTSGIREHSGATVLAVENADHSRLDTPHPDTELSPGLLVVVVGTRAQVDLANAMLCEMASGITTREN